MLSEKEVEGMLRHGVRKLGGLCWKLVSPGTRGVPDRVIIMPGGRVVFVELKRIGGKPTELQQRRIDELKALGADARLVKGENQVWSLLDELDREYANREVVPNDFQTP